VVEGGRERRAGGEKRVQRGTSKRPNNQRFPIKLMTPGALGALGPLARADYE
jgi:hypothetical protein